MATDSVRIAGELGLAESRVRAAIELLDAGNTLPFIARYRKEATGTLDEEELRSIVALLESLRALDERRATILAAITEQGKLTPELRAQIEAAPTRTVLEDLYTPYKQKRRTRATVARELGFQPLADRILAQDRHPETPAAAARPFVCEGAPDVESVLAGARDIVAEAISDNANVRATLRDKALRFGEVAAAKIDDAEDERSVFQLYYAFKLRVDRIRPHQILALNRGEALKVLRVHLDVPERDWHGAILGVYPINPRSPWADELRSAAEDSGKRLLLPAIERDVRNHLTEQAEQHAIQVFAANLRGLLNQPPLAGHTVLGIDPGFRTGSKVAVVDPSGRLLATATIYPHPPQNQRREATAALRKLIEQHRVTLITIGNGTASRETEMLVAEMIRDWRSEIGDRRLGTGATVSNLQSQVSNLQYLIVNEAGASVYSASTLARAELPDLDVSLRGAVSIARRAQDPLAELVKIDPKSIGVGLYQHDVDQKALSRTLDGVVESAVNQVGVDLNTASPALLTYVAGVGPKLAEKIVAYRDEQGPYPNRAAVKKVAGLGPKAFEQAAGFLRVRAGSEPLDASAIHPESYATARQVLKLAGVDMTAPAPVRMEYLTALRKQIPLPQIATQLGAGEPTLVDIFEQLMRPGRDPREDVPAPILRSEVLSMDDLKPGLRLMGTVRNVVDFGAFVDIGVKQDGLLHRSRLPDGAALGVGDIIEVEVLSVEQGRGRISLGWPDLKQADWAAKA